MTMFWKVLGDICLYFSVLGAFPQIFVTDMTLLWPALLCAAGTWIAGVISDRGLNGIRFAGVILGAASLILADSTIEYVMLIPAIVYSTVLIVRDETALEYYSFREYFRRALTAWAIFLLLIWVGGTFEEMTRPGIEHALNYTTVLAYGALFAVSGVVLQRQLRMGEGHAQSRRLTGTQSAVVAVILAVVLLGVLVLEYYLHDQATSVLNLLGKILRWVFSAPIVLIAWIIGLLMEGPLREAKQAMETVGTEPTVTVTGTMPTGTGGEYVQPTVEVGYPWWFVVLILALMTVMLVYMVAVHRRRVKTPASRETTGRAETEAPPAKESRRSNRAKVRRCYREFLRQERRRGLVLRRDHTSEDILKQASGNQKAAAQLREIYIQARYNKKAAVTAEQVKVAKEALRKTKET